MLKAFEHKITPIICCGESLVQREQGITIDWIRQQIKIAFLNVTAEQAKTAVIAYEPIWCLKKAATKYSVHAISPWVAVCDSLLHTCIYLLIIVYDLPEILHS